MVSEFDIIEQIKALSLPLDESVIAGIGDDAAVINISGNSPLLTTTDCLVESVHFSWDYMSPRDVGFKSLAVNISDLAAMGAKPTYALVSLGIPPDFNPINILQYYEGFFNLGKKYNINLIGGNLTRSPNHFFTSVTLMGTPWTKNIFYRHTACEDDVICLSGSLGKSALGLRLLQSCPDIHNKFTQHHKTPQPRSDAAEFLAAQDGVHAVIDISDGLSSDLHHVLQASRKGALIDMRDFPIESNFKTICLENKFDYLDLILNGGEDYELLVTLKRDKATDIINQAQKNNLTIHPIGYITSVDQGVLIMHQDGIKSNLLPQGFRHF